MKRFIMFLFCTFCVNYAFADISLVNENQSNSIEVSYRFCRTTPGSPVITCSGINTVIAKTNPIRVVSIPVLSDMQALLIVAAVERDASGKIVAQGKYEIDPGHSHCGYPLANGAIKNNIIISLSDMQGASIIRCLANGY